MGDGAPDILFIPGFVSNVELLRRTCCAGCRPPSRDRGARRATHREVERRADEVAGIGVHIGARVSALAGPGEVLVTSTVKDLVIGAELSFDDRGACALRGVPGEWHLWSAN
jgi:hypothetical protein